MIVGEEAHDDVGCFSQSADRSEIRSKICGLPFLDELRRGPGVISETALEVATADEEQLRFDSYGEKCATLKLGHGTGAGPLVRRDNQAYPH